VALTGSFLSWASSLQRPGDEDYQTMNCTTHFRF
jgi:hypothetical protein